MRNVKRLALALLFALAVSCAQAEEALYPIRENGLWGYMNRQGEVVIQPQWDVAEAFSNGYAIVGVRMDAAEDVWDPYDYGLLRCDGTMILPERYGIVETAGGYWYAPRDEEAREYGLCGFFDRASGFLLPPAYDSIMDWYGGDLIIAENWDFDANLARYGFLRRDTGEIVFPLDFTGLYDDVGCSEGYVLAAFERGLTGDGSVWGPDYHLYTVDGEEIFFPEGIRPDSIVLDGVLRVSRDLTDEEREDYPGTWGTVYGLGRPDGTVIVPPQYLYLWEPDADGMICILNRDERGRILCGVMDTDGNVIVPPRYVIETGGALPYLGFCNGYAVIVDEGEKWQETERTVILNTAGQEIFSRPTHGDGGQFFRLEEWLYFSYVQESGLVWYSAGAAARPGEPSHARYGLLQVTGGRVETLTEPIFEAHIGGVLVDEDLEDQVDFSEGVHPVKLGGLWGYIDQRAEWVIPPQWEEASSFQNGLALVEKEGKLLYIDHDGAVVWREP